MWQTSELSGLCARLVKSGETWISTTVLHGRQTVLRACITNYRNGPQDVEALVMSLGRIFKRVTLTWLFGMSQQRIVVAIDGPAGAGKSTIARSVAARLGFVYIDTGAMYRAVALWALRAGIDEAETHKIEQLAREAEITFEPGTRSVFLNGEDVTEAIRIPEVSSAASKVSAIAGVRRVLVEKQREMASVVAW